MLKKVAKIVTNNFGLKVMALLFAVVLWLVVVNIDDPMQTKSFTTSVLIENEGAIADMGKCYEIENGSNTVTFKVSAKRSVLRMLSNTDFRATADMSRIEDWARVPIEITATRYTSSVTFSSRTQYLEVSVEDLQTKQLAINADYEGTPAVGCAIGEVRVIAPNVVRVSGPASLVSQVDSAKASINVEGITTTITDSVVPILLDKAGNPIDTTKLELNVQTVNIRAEVLDVKGVVVNVAVSGTPKSGYVSMEAVCSPQTVSIKGPAATLNTVNSIDIPEGIVDISDASETVVQTVDISTYLPEGVTLVNDEDKKIQVTVAIEQIETRLIEIPTKNITVKNLSSAYQASFAEDTVEVYVRGLQSDLDKLNPDGIRVSVDAAGLTEGEHVLELVLELDEELYSTDGKQTVMLEVKEKKQQSDDSDDKKDSGDDSKDDGNDDAKDDSNGDVSGDASKKTTGSGSANDKLEDLTER